MLMMAAFAKSANRLLLHGRVVEGCGMGMPEQGEHYEISVDGEPSSNRDDREIAIAAGKYLKGLHPNSEVIVRDVRDGISTRIGWEKLAARPQQARRQRRPLCD
jgi:hypothetical protein